MSLHTIGSDARYVLPASYDSVPEAFRSNKSAKPIPSSLQTVNIPALSGNQSLGGSSILQIPCGASAGYMCNPYLRFSVSAKQSGKAGAEYTVKWKGAAQSATACFNRLATFVNSQQIDNLQNAGIALYDPLLSHSTSNDWLVNDATVLLGAGKEIAKVAKDAENTEVALGTYVAPLLGFLGTQQAIPLFLINGSLQIQIDWVSSVASALTKSAGTAVGDFATMQFYDVQLVYDKISCEQAFVDSVRSDMMKGNKFILSYTNYQSTFLQQAIGGSSTFNYGLNVSSLRGVVMTQTATDALTAVDATGYSLANGLTNLQVSLDGRLMNTVQQNTTTALAVVFAEFQKCMGRLFDASITEPVSSNDYSLKSFAAGVSCQRVNEGLAFSGTPCSVASIQLVGATAAVLQYLLFISDFQVAISADGAIEMIR